MKYKIKQLIEESKIINFFSNLDKKILSYFFSSEIYQFFAKVYKFFKNIVLRNKGQSLVIKFTKKIFAYIKLRDVGLFIALVVIFNTVIILALKKEIDMLSRVARMFFFFLGILLILRRK